MCGLAVVDEEAAKIATKFETKAQVEKISKKRELSRSRCLSRGKVLPVVSFLFRRSFHNNIFALLKTEKRTTKKKLVKPEAMLQHTQRNYTMCSEF